MSSTANSTAFVRGTDPILRILSPDQARQIAEYHADDELQGRIEELAGKANEGELSQEEREEYDGYVQANAFIAVLQARARRFLATAPEV